MQSAPASLGQYLEDFSSLLKKVDLLYHKCRPPARWASVEGYEFNLDRLKRLDQLRHQIVHGEALGAAIANPDEELEYLWNTNNHLVLLVGYRYKIQIRSRSTLRQGGSI